VTIGPLRWNTTATTVAGQLTATSATPNYLNFPIGIFIDSSDTLYVSDADNNRIQQFSLGNTTGRTAAGQSNGAVGTSATFLHLPSDVAADSSGNVYVADSYNNRIQLWPANATSGITVAGTGK
jgi:sugar lactone lactonase YvrE